jgi:Sulfotransferase family
MAYPYAVRLIRDQYDDLDIDPHDLAWHLRLATFVNVPKRYMYFSVAKAASTEMRHLLRSLEGAPPMKLLGAPGQRRDMFVHYRMNMPLPSLVDLDDRTQREVLESPDFFRLTFVRNPYTRLVSAWKGKILVCAPRQDLYEAIKGHPPEFGPKSLVSFREFVDYIAANCDLRWACDWHWRCQVNQIFFKAVNFSHIGKVERMDEGLRRFQEHLGLATPLSLGRRNAAVRTALPTYDQELADKVYLLYQEDFEKLGYGREAWRDGKQATGDMPGAGLVPEEKFYDEIIERNLVIAGLYRELERSRAELRMLSWRHRLDSAFAQAWDTARRIWRKLLWGGRVRVWQMLR